MPRLEPRATPMTRRSGSTNSRSRSVPCGSKSSKGATPSASGQSVSPFASHAESLLPATPPRSQFVFEVEKPLMIHAAVDEHRQLQRRLSMMGALEQETIKLEKQPKGAQLQIIQARSMAYPAPPLPAFH